MYSRPPNKLLLLVTLLLCQWMVFAHAFNHPALSGQDQACEVCVHAQGADGGSALDSGHAALPPLVPHESPAAVIRVAIGARPIRKQPIRGPPLLTA